MLGMLRFTYLDITPFDLSPFHLDVRFPAKVGGTLVRMNRFGDLYKQKKKLSYG